MLKKQSITLQMLLSVMSITIMISIFGIIFNVLNSINTQKNSFIYQSELEIKLIADFVSAPLAFGDTLAISDAFASLKHRESIRYATVYSPDKNALVTFNPYDYEVPKQMQKIESLFISDNPLILDFGLYNQTIPIKQDESLLGYIHIQKKTQSITDSTKDLLVKSLIFLLLIILLTYFISKSLSRKILHPIIHLASVAHRVANSKDYSIRVKHNKDNEIQTLYNAFNTLLKDTDSLTSNLETRVQERTHELEQSIEALKSVQTQLIESEKMASLGSLVSGIAHEVNTPLGNALTGGSIIVHETKELTRQINEGTIKKSTMLKSLDVLNESSQVLMLSIKRAADLIRSFKKISIDQSVESRQKFNLYSYLEEVLLTFHNKLKKVPIKATITGDKELVVNSFPGSYAQIFSNLIQNTLIHAYNKNKKDAKVSISIVNNGDSFTLIYEDNGDGMDESIIKNAFEPFSTTRRNMGGTGLGLNIVYNLTTQKLHGKIKLDTSPDNGTKFTFTIPISEN
ncbi:HAMP domain-containing protein [Sulfurimonas aquatica]|uniref:histidine kinase n=1 Tax=Sulfurimonas aquatica TaxID=2672570 RepID=A0A975GDJ0_9BACT|nr:ATP-binding protein [Sulfurimonas aquatica]QSZ42413.1 HAMP domain-containing protein [Sulfurimonas aquatica]